MRKKEFMDKLCWALAKFDMADQPNHNAFPCICGENPAATNDSEVCAETAERILAAIKYLSDRQPWYCPLCNQKGECVMEAEDPTLSLYTCKNPKCPEEN